MSTMDQLKARTKEVMDAAGKMAGEVLDLSKNKVQELKLTGELKDAYARLGNVVYESRRSQVNNDQLVDLIMGEIDTLKKSLEQLSPKEETSGREVHCPQCGAVNGAKFSFCAKCGAFLTQQTPVE